MTREPLSPDDLIDVAIEWRHTGDAEFPYAAQAGGKPYTVRINDFPAEPLYTLMSDGVELLDLEDWPAKWTKPAPPQALIDRLLPKRGR